jgi:hypothetical protein
MPHYGYSRFVVSFNGGTWRSTMKNLKRQPQEARGEVREPDPLLTQEQRERQQRAAALVREWAQEEDDGLWPLVEQELGLKR